MRKLILLLLAITGAFSANAVPKVNEAARAINLCGKPQYDRKMKDSAGLPLRGLVYPDLLVVFIDRGDGWKLSMAKDSDRKTYDPSGAAAMMPCLSTLVPSKVASNAVAPVPAKEEDISTSSGFLAFVAFIALLMFWQIRKGWVWGQRPKRLCVSCNSVRQPSQHKKTNRLFCPVCNAGNPIPLDSPAAVEYMRIKGH